jgi:hypothetical protein
MAKRAKGEEGKGERGKRIKGKEGKRQKTCPLPRIWGRGHGEGERIFR